MKIPQFNHLMIAIGKLDAVAFEAHESALRAMEYLQAGTCRSLMETLDAMEKHENLSSEDRRR